MVKKLLLSAGLAVTLAACAHDPSAPSSSTSARARVPPPGCVNSATRLPPDHLCPGPGSTYTQGDIRQTGQTNVGDALRMLDPSITVHGGP
jgi:hypothetical protein